MSDMFYMLKGDAGAVGDGSTDDSAAIASWIAHGLSTGQTLGAEPGNYFSPSQAVIDLVGKESVGLKIQGSGRARTVFSSSYNSASPFIIKDSGNTGFLFVDVLDVSFTGNCPHPVLQLGQENFADALNSSEFKINVTNGDTSANACAMEINFALNCKFNILANCQGHGDALRCRQLQMSEVFASVGGADIGVHLTAGYNLWSTFNSIDAEQLGVCVQSDSGSNTKNVFIAGQFNYNHYGLNFTAGDAYFIRPQSSPNPGATGWIENNSGITQA